MIPHILVWKKTKVRMDMDKYNVYQDIGKRTGGDLFFGVVGPVRTGKSTFIKRFMELVVQIGRASCRERV